MYQASSPTCQPQHPGKTSRCLTAAGGGRLRPSPGHRAERVGARAAEGAAACEGGASQAALRTRHVGAEAYAYTCTVHSSTINCVNLYPLLQLQGANKLPTSPQLIRPDSSNRFVLPKRFAGLRLMIQAFSARPSPRLPHRIFGCWCKGFTLP